MSKTHASFLLCLFSLMIGSMVSAEMFLRTFSAADGTHFDYVLVLPDDFDASKTYPTLLALPPGDQSLAMVEAGFGYWFGGEKRGWVIISPVAPEGSLFFQGSDIYIPELLDELARNIQYEENKVHLAGISNGGRSAFRLAIDYPERFHSLLAVPGFPPEEDDFTKLERLKDISVTMYAGEHDTLWVEQMLKTEAALKANNGIVAATVVLNEGHVIQSLNPDVIYALLDQLR